VEEQPDLSDWANHLRFLISDEREFGQAIIVAAQLGIADHLQDGARTVAELAEATATHEQSLYRLLRYLVSRGIFDEVGDRRFSMTADAEPLLTDHPNSIRTAAGWNGSEAYLRTWMNLSYSIRTGRPAFEHLYGKPFFEHLADDQQLGQTFSDVMTRSSVNDGVAIVDAHDFSRYKAIVDVGGAHGAMLALILERYPEPSGVLFDAPEVIEAAYGAIDEHMKNGRVRAVAGNFFDSVPTGDVYLLKFIIHDWDDDHAVTILKSCRTAMAADGRVLLVEMIVPDGNAESMAKHRDLTMLVFLHGQERTEGQYAELLRAAGLRHVRTSPTASAFSVIEAVPA
jgi:hypothetical protein